MLFFVTFYVYANFTCTTKVVHGHNLIGALNIVSFDLLIFDLKVHITFEKFAKVTFTTDNCATEI